MPQIIGVLISNKICSYLELNDISYNECVKLFDIVLTNNYNNMVLHENNKES
jgi:hypothetical protein